jgi:hypothetical protein
MDNERGSLDQRWDRTCRDSLERKHNQAGSHSLHLTSFAEMASFGKVSWHRLTPESAAAE